MKKVKYSSLGFDINLSAPESVAEFDKNAKKDGACLQEATNNVIYRGTLAEFRSIFLMGLDAADIDDAMKAAGYKPVAGLEQVTKITRKTEVVLDKDKKPKVVDGEEVTQYSETEAEYLKRVLAETKKTVADFAPLAQQVADMIPFDASSPERKPAGPKKLAQDSKDTAVQLIDHKKAATKVPAFIEMFKKALPTEPATIPEGVDANGVPKKTEKNIEALGWMIQKYNKWDAEQAKKARTAKLLAD